jgi:hypothetical protein
VILSCIPEGGPGGNSTIAFTTKHHEVIIPHCRVFIKYGDRSFPGEDTTIYDDAVTSDNSGNGSFEGLTRGAYYIYGVGFDTSINQPVYGGTPVTIGKNEEVKTIVVPVVEN